MTTDSCIWTEWRLIKVTVSVARGKKDSSVFFLLFSSFFFTAPFFVHLSVTS